jgi:alcohol dehydrogenase class IV
VLSGISGDPTTGSVRQTADRLSEINPDWIIACGGGAVIDLAKLAWAVYEHPDFDLTGRPRAFSLPGLRSKARLSIIPTTSGTGSEASIVAVVTDGEGKRKIPIVSDELLPDLVILDPSLTTTLSSAVTAYTAMDAFTHAVESYCSTINNRLADNYSVPAAKSIVRHLSTAISDPENLDAREELQYAAMFAGMAQNMTSVGATHALSHAVGAAGGVAHGMGNAIFLRGVLSFNAEESPKPSVFANEIGFSSLDGMVDWISEILQQAGLPETLGGAATDGVDLNVEEVAQAALGDICLRTNPRKMGEQDLLDLLSANA